MPDQPNNFTLVIRQAIPELGMQANDVIVVDPEDDDPLVFSRAIAPIHAGVLAYAVTQGIVELCDAERMDCLLIALGRILAKVARGATPVAATQPVPGGPIDVDAALEELASPTAKAPKERYAGSLIENLHGEKAWRDFFRRRDLYERHRPRVCHTCGEEFVAGNSTSAVTCQTCKKARRKRCCQCGEVFKVESNKEKRCVSCLRRAAEAGEASAADQLRRKSAATSQPPKPTNGQRGRKAS
jgi:hypothetical protein